MKQEKKRIEMKTKIQDKVQKKREEEKNSMEVMIGIYCRGVHHKRNALCPKCQELLTYANMRIDKCPFMETKTFCSACKVHCYRLEQREQVRQIMRYAGPRMLMVNPVMACKHVWTTIKKNRKV